MELSLREQRDHCEREKYRLEQESSRIRAIQEAAEADRLKTMLQLDEERTNVQRAREHMLSERRSTMVSAVSWFCARAGCFLACVGRWRSRCEAQLACMSTQ